MVRRWESYPGSGEKDGGKHAISKKDFMEDNDPDQGKTCKSCRSVVSSINATC